MLGLGLHLMTRGSGSRVGGGSAGPTIAPPGAPTGLVASDVGGGVGLNWTLADALDTSVKVFAAAEGGSLALLDTLAAQSASYATEYIWDSAQRAFRIDAVNADGATPSTVIYTRPSPCDSLGLTAQAELQISVSWSHLVAAAPWIQGYTVEARNITQAGGWEVVMGTPPGTTTGLINCEAMSPAGGDGDQIEVRVRAYKGALNSDWVADSVFIYI